jgi:hypothetical protein
VNIHDVDIAQQMESMFFEDLAHSNEITLRHWFRRPRLAKLKEKLADVLKQQL